MILLAIIVFIGLIAQFSLIGELESKINRDKEKSDSDGKY